MKLRNKKTGEIVEYVSFKSGGSQIVFYAYDTAKHYYYNSLAEFNEEWEDYKEPKEYWHIDCDGEIVKDKYEETSFDKDCKSIGNYFETREEAEQAVEKLKAWERLRKGGCKIVGWDYSDNVDLNGCKFNDDDFIIGLSAGDINEEDLDLLFGGENETDN